MSNSEKTLDLKFSPFSSFVEPTFWHKLSQIKLDIDRLEEKVRPIWGYYSNSNPPGLSCTLQVDCSAFNNETGAVAPMQSACGVLLNKNTIETFKNCDKIKLLEEYGCQLWQDIVSGSADKNPNLLTRFILLTYADLKKHHFYYWFAFPAPNFDITTTLVGSIRKLSDVRSEADIGNLTRNYTAEMARGGVCSFFSCASNGDILPLSTMATEAGDSVLNVVGFTDPCTLPDHPGWPLRNLLAWLSCRCPHLVGKEVEIVALRLELFDSSWTCRNSLIFRVTLPPLPPELLASSSPETAGVEIKWVGWERNDRGKFGPRMANLSSSMDPVRLAENSVDLNLKLMKWRLLPELDLDIVKRTRCLLLGAGTLGCSVARNLLAWGVHNITMVDNGRVSYSNPVRQSLYTHSVCVNGGEQKAPAAAKALKDIFPGVESQGIVLSIPMPGHPIGDSLLAETMSSVAMLEDLITSHDVVFLLMDSRESRWLPTLVAASKDKIVMNAALGFDTYLVMRHGSRPEEGSGPAPAHSAGAAAVPGHQLGCYFCNDVTAPGDSQRDRTLDQQCTVTRPGVSGIAAALVVELMVSVLQHPLRARAPADLGCDGSQESILGIIPHSIRGFLSQFNQVSLFCQRFENCIACSHKIVSEYETRGFEFLLQAFNTPHYLEDITGLTKMKAETENAEIWELSDSDTDEME